MAKSIFPPGVLVGITFGKWVSLLRENRGPPGESSQWLRRPRGRRVLRWTPDVPAGRREMGKKGRSEKALNTEHKAEATPMALPGERAPDSKSSLPVMRLLIPPPRPGAPRFADETG